MNSLLPKNKSSWRPLTPVKLEAHSCPAILAEGFSNTLQHKKSIAKQNLPY